MAEIVVLGAGLGGTLAAFELTDQVRPEDRITLIGERNTFQFTPSNPWVAVGWRKRPEIEVELERVMKRKNIALRTEGALRVHPAENRVELNGGESIPYDYLVIATGSDLAFDEVPGLGPEANTVSICQSDHAEAACKSFEEFCADPGPVVVGADGNVAATHELPTKFTMFLPAFRGVPAIRGIAGLVNPRGFVLIDDHQRNPTYKNVFGIGVYIAIPPVGATPVPAGVPKTGFMIESMVTATAHNIGALLRGDEPQEQATWNAVCLADFGDGGVAFVARPQLPPRNVNWAAQGAWVHLAKVAFEKYFLRKFRAGASEPFNERFLMRQLNIHKLKETGKTLGMRAANG